VDVTMGVGVEAGLTRCDCEVIYSAGWMDGLRVGWLIDVIFCRSRRGMLRSICGRGTEG
jgi:hypothetical protein